MKPGPYNLKPGAYNVKPGAYIVKPGAYIVKLGAHDVEPGPYDGKSGASVQGGVPRKSLGFDGFVRKRGGLCGFCGGWPGAYNVM